MTENLGQSGGVRGTETGTSNEQSPFGQEAPVQVAQAAPVQVAAVQVAQAGNVVGQPAAGEQIVVQAAAGQRYVVEFDTDAAQVSVQGNDLVLRFPDGATITFAGLGQFSGDPNAPVFEVAGQPVSGDVIFAQAAVLAGGEDAPSFETAAGQGEAVGTGETRYDDDTGQLIDLIDPQGVIPPTELAFRLIDLEPSEVLLPVEAPALALIQPLTPPVDFDVSVTAGFVNSLAGAGLSFVPGLGFGVGGGGTPTPVLAVAASPGGSGGGSIFVTGHDSEEHSNAEYMNAGLDFLAFGHKATGAELTQRGSLKVAFLNPNNDTGAIAAIQSGGWDVTFFDLDNDFSAAFNGAFDLIMVGSGDGASGHRDALFNAKADFEAFINGGGGLYINTDEGFGQTWYDFVPNFGTATNNTISASGAFTPTAPGLSIGLTDAIVDRDITHSFYTGVDTNLFTVFEVTDPARFPNNPNLPVAFGSRNIGISDGEFVDAGESPGGWLYEFQVGEAEIVADNIHGTDVEDGVTTQFTITTLPTDENGNPVGFLLIDRGDDMVIEEIVGPGFSSVPIDVQTGDSVYYFLPSDGETPPPDLVTFNYFTTDSDGLDSLNDGPATVTIDFPEEDDVPQAQDTAMVHDETPGVDNPNDVSLASFSAGLAAALSAVFAGTAPPALGAAKNSVAFDFGQNGPGSLGLSGVSSGGLTDTQTGLAVDVVNGPNGTLVGHAGVNGPIVFVAFLEQVGSLSGTDNAGTADAWFVQYRAVEHDNPADPDEANPESGFTDEAIVLSYDVTDADGDTDSGTITVSVEDDGPSVSGTTMINDETFGIGDNTPSDDIDLPANLPGEIAAFGLTPINAAKKAIPFDYGADGPGGIGLDPVVDGTDSGLIDTATGDPIMLFNGPGGTIIGRTCGIEGPIVFVSVLVETGTPSGLDNASSADLWFVQFRAIQHDNPFDHDEVNPEPSNGPVPPTEVIDFEGQPAGTVLSSITTSFGTVLVTGVNPDPNDTIPDGTNTAVIFDSANPTGGDVDLGSPNSDFGGPGIDADGDPTIGGNAGSAFENDTPHGNLLIVGENLVDSDGDGLVDSPDDATVVGSKLTFDFSQIGPVTMESISILDVERDEIPARVDLFDGNGVLVRSFLLPQTGDNGAADVSLGNTTGIERMEVRLNGSGAIDNIAFHPDDHGFEDEFLTLDYTVTDRDGDSVGASATITIEDDGPTAVDDPLATVAAGGSTGGNVIQDVPGQDDLGVDGPSADGPLTLFSYIGNDGFGSPIEFTAPADTTVKTFAGGDLTVNADGSWTYVAPGNAGTGRDDFTYIIEDGDGDTDSAVQAIEVGGGQVFFAAALISGGSGSANVIEGTAGNDQMFGSDGDDIVIGGLGDDVVFGGDGADRFSFSLAADEGSDLIGDFSVAEGDTLEFTDVVDPADTVVKASFNKAGATVTVDLESGTSLTIVDIDNAINSADDLLNNSVLV